MKPTKCDERLSLRSQTHDGLLAKKDWKEEQRWRSELMQSLLTAASRGRGGLTKMMGQDQTFIVTRHSLIHSNRIDTQFMTENLN